MVKGVSRQVILVHSPDKKLFEQAIFILREDALGEGITEEELLREAKLLIKGPISGSGRPGAVLHGAFWAGTGAVLTGIAWLVTALL